MDLIRQKDWFSIFIKPILSVSMGLSGINSRRIVHLVHISNVVSAWVYSHLVDHIHSDTRKTGTSNPDSCIKASYVRSISLLYSSFCILCLLAWLSGELLDYCIIVAFRLEPHSSLLSLDSFHFNFFIQKFVLSRK